MLSDNKTIRLFVSGFGGTGKSYLIENLVIWNKLKRKKNIAVAAPTGIAAFNIQGLTVHRLLQLPVEQGDTAKYKPLSDNALKRIRQSLKDIHIVVFGDLLQLPPVREEFAFIPLTKAQINKYIKGMLSFNLWTLFKYEELNINMRQKTDKVYSEILGKLRLGYLANSDIETLLKRKISFSSHTPSISLHELYEYLNNLPSNTRLEKRILKMLNEDDDNACGISQVITIKIGCKIMIRRNIDVSVGLVNGTIATVIAVNKGKTGIDSIAIRLESNQDYAITIHKSQGLNLENAVVEAGNSIFSCGQTYVALSRITKLEGLHLINFDPSSVKADESAIRE
ncbi:ATP-dependent DNA helicase PIF1-like [Phymastichus coffea]|uniref:ATP-dependent DNA helicase PIF1-like n=1 Tax=Phymastichus coffea TaxID=108790 RepID=UPI00273A9B65|nr:ATP-dependent DNA helicase PIF1-like [Phymastichus coffea]